MWLLVGAYTTALSVLTSLKHYCFRSYAFDLGIWIQVFWHTLRGNFLYAMPRWGPTLHPPNVLGSHVNPLVLLLLPIYAAASSPYTLLVLQSLVLALPAVYLYRTAKLMTGVRTARIVAALYLVFPGTLWPNWYDFHFQAFAPLFFSMAYYYYLARDERKMAVALALLLAVGEYTAPLVAFFAVYILAKERTTPIRRYLSELLTARRRRLLSVGLLVAVSIGYYLLCQQIKRSVFPARDVYFRFQLFEPITGAQFLAKILYLVALFGPVVFLPLLAPTALLPAVPVLGFAMLTAQWTYFQITWQYPALISIPIFVATIAALPKLRAANVRRVEWRLIASALCFLVVLSPLSPIAATFNPDYGIHVPTARTVHIHQALAAIPANATVLAQENIFPHVAERPTAFTVWPPANISAPPDYILVDVTESYWYRAPPEYPINAQVRALTRAYAYELTDAIGGFLIYRLAP
jgi:uncharacterized membrane protein